LGDNFELKPRPPLTMSYQFIYVLNPPGGDTMTYVLWFVSLFLHGGVVTFCLLQFIIYLLQLFLGD
jgi:hypothetical protein